MSQPESTPSETTARWFEQFIQQGTYLRDWSPQTSRTYRLAFRDCPKQFTKDGLDAAVMAMRQRGLSPGGINLRARSINSFLTWLHEQGHVAERLRIKLLRNPPKPVHALSEQDIKWLMAFRPNGKVQTRTWVLALLLLDCGLRIGEALTLERSNVDFDDLTLRVLGKGRKERLLPFSSELRKLLFRLCAKTPGRYVFHTDRGAHLSRNHAYRDLRHLCARLSLKGGTNPHAFRHTFAVQATKNGLDVYRLSRILGHSSITTTQLYLRSMGVEHLRDGHERFSPLARQS